MMTTNLTRVMALAALILILQAGVIQASQEAAGTDSASLTDIKVSFKLDSRLTRGMYMGDLWVSQPTYIGASGQDTIEAMALGIDGRGKTVDISPEWVPADPEMVAVSPRQGKQVKITVHRAGESKLKVVSQEVSRELFIKATYKGAIIHAEISGGQASAGEQREPKKDAGSQKEKLGYSLGYDTGRQMRKHAIDVDPEIYIKAFREGFAGDKAVMTDQEMGDILKAFQQEIMIRQKNEKKDIAVKNREVGEVFLSENAKKEGVVTLPSGLQYKVIKEGTGKQPAKTDKVKVHYRGALINGTQFDSSYRRSAPATLAVDKVIKGWTEALQLMKEGSKWMLYIPSDLAYGARGVSRGKIGPNQTLIFEVELISIQEKE